MPPASSCVILARHAGFRRHETRERHLSGAHGLAEFPQVSTGADIATAKFAVEHGTGGDDEGGEIDGPSGSGGSLKRHAMRFSGQAAVSALGVPTAHGAADVANVTGGGK
jgi:hypothetical protein